MVEEADPVYKYVDDKVDALKSDLLINEIGELQDKISNLEKSIIDLRRENYRAQMRRLEVFLFQHIHDNSGTHLPVPPHRLLRPSTTCIAEIQTLLIQAFERIGQITEREQMQTLWAELPRKINTTLTRWNYPPIELMT